jgi:hypothetical protein
LFPATTDAGPVLLIERSALAATGVEAVELLLPETGSVVEVETDAVFTIGAGVVYDDGTEYVVVIVRVAPLATVPSEQGYAVVQDPVLETKVRPVGVVSATDTDAASELPLLVTVTV